MSENTYVMFDVEDTVINILILDQEPVGQETVDLLKEQNGAHSVARIDNGQECGNNTPTLQTYNAPSIGSKLIGDTFLPPQPSPDYILDPTNTSWVLPYSLRTFEEDPNINLDLELNYWDEP